MIDPKTKKEADRETVDLDTFGRAVDLLKRVQEQMDDDLERDSVLWKDIKEFLIHLRLRAVSEGWVWGP